MLVPSVKVDGHCVLTIYRELVKASERLSNRVNDVYSGKVDESLEHFLGARGDLQKDSITPAIAEHPGC